MSETIEEREMERRFFRGEVRMTGEGEQRRIVGHGAVFNQLSENLGGFREIIEPGAFSETLDGDVRSLFNHNPDLILGRTTSQTLEIAEDEVGLRYEVEPPDTSYAKDLEASIERGDVDGSSFGFRVIEESWRQPDDKNPLPVRRLLKVKLFDVGPVTFPAYPQTDVSMRALDKAKELAGGGQAEEGRAVGRLALLRRRLELEAIIN